MTRADGPEPVRPHRGGAAGCPQRASRSLRALTPFLRWRGSPHPARSCGGPPRPGNTSDLGARCPARHAEPGPHSRRLPSRSPSPRRRWPPRRALAAPRACSTRVNNTHAKLAECITLDGRARAPGRAAGDRRRQPRHPRLGLPGLRRLGRLRRAAADGRRLHPAGAAVRVQHLHHARPRGARAGRAGAGRPGGAPRS